MRTESNTQLQNAAEAVINPATEEKQDAAIANTGISAADTSSIDAFGRWRVSGTGQRFDVEFIYDKQPDVIDEVTSDSGTATHDANARDVTLAIGGTENTGEAALYSYDIPYTPGNSQLIDITGVLDYADIGSGTAEIFHRTKVSGSVVETTYAQATWESNTTGVDWALSHIFSIDFQSLKVGRLRFYLVQDGLPVKLMEITNDNLRNAGYWQLPSLPVYWRIYNDADNTYMEMGYGDEDNGVGLRYTITKNANATMKAICATVKSEGGKDLFDVPGYQRAIDMGVTEKTASTTLIPLLSIRPDTAFASLTNRALIIPLTLTLTTDNPTRFVLISGTALTGASWADVDTTNSCVEYDVTASALSGGKVIASEYVTAGKNTPTTGGNLLGRALLWNSRTATQKVLTIAAIKTGATDASVLAGITWKEIR